MYVNSTHIRSMPFCALKQKEDARESNERKQKKVSRQLNWTENWNAQTAHGTHSYRQPENRSCRIRSERARASRNHRREENKIKNNWYRNDGRISVYADATDRWRTQRGMPKRMFACFCCAFIEKRWLCARARKASKKSIKCTKL